MTRERLTTLRLCTVVLALALCGFSVAGGAGESADQGAAAPARGQGTQQIYLDPDTGEVIPPPDEASRPHADKTTPGNVPSDRQSATRAKAWKNDEGVHMLTPDPESMPKEQAVHCPDGSLRIGRGARRALCADHRD